MDEIITYGGSVELIPAQRPASSLQAVPQFDGDMFRRFIEYTDRKDTTIKGYLTYIRQFAKWLSDNGITQPQRDDVRAYRDHLTTSGLSTGTQTQYLRAVKHFFKWTAADGIYPNIADNIHGATDPAAQDEPSAEPMYIGDIRRYRAQMAKWAMPDNFRELEQKASEKDYMPIRRNEPCRSSP